MINTITKPIINGQVDKSDIQSMIMSSAALTSLLFSFKTNQLWGVVSKELIRVESDTGRWVYKKLIEVSRKQYGKRWSQALGGTFEEQANRFLKLGAAMSVFGVIANAVETWQILGTKVGEATNTSEKYALMIKGYATGAMGGVFAYQLISTTLRRAWLGKAFGAWGTLAMLVASIIYLAADYFASLFRYEGFELWCSRCIWSKKAPYWLDTEQGNQEEIRALQEILMAPQLVIIPHNTLLNTQQKAYFIFDTYLILPPLPDNTLGQLKVEIGIDNMFGSGSTSGGKNNYIYKPEELIDFTEDLEVNQQWVLREDFEKQCEKAKQFNAILPPITDDESDFAEVSGEVDASQLVWFSRGMVESKGWSRIRYEFEFTYPPELLTPRLDKRGYQFTVDALGPKVLSPIYRVKPSDNAMENSQDKSTYTVKESEKMAVSDSPYQVTIFPPLFES